MDWLEELSDHKLLIFRYWRLAHVIELQKVERTCITM
jgi:hypothetical protein